MATSVEQSGLKRVKRQQEAGDNHGTSKGARQRRGLGPILRELDICGSPVATSKQEPMG